MPRRTPVRPPAYTLAAGPRDTIRAALDDPTLTQDELAAVAPAYQNPNAAPTSSLPPSHTPPSARGWSRATPPTLTPQSERWSPRTAWRPGPPCRSSPSTPTHRLPRPPSTALTTQPRRRPRRRCGDRAGDRSSSPVATRVATGLCTAHGGLNHVRHLHWCLVLPEPEHRPAGGLECCGCVSVTRPIRRDLRCPELRVGPCRSIVLGAPMPIATVDQHDDTTPRERDIHRAPQLWHRAVVDPVAQPSPV